MQRFVLKKLFDIRPLTKKGELNLRWILRSEKTVEVKNIPKSERVLRENTYKQNKNKKDHTEIPKRPGFSLPAWDKKNQKVVTPEYEYEQIRQAILDELDDLELKEAKLKHDFGPPLNLPISISIEKEAKKEKALSLILRKISPRIINLKERLPQIKLTPSLKYAFVSVLVLIIIIPSVRLVSNFSSTKDFVVNSGEKGYQNLLDAKNALLSFNPVKASQDFKEAYENFNQASKTINSLGGSLLEVVDILPLRYKVSAGRKLLSAGENISKAGDYLANGLEIINNLKIDSIIRGKDEISTEENKPTDYIKQFRQEFSLAKNELEKGFATIQGIEPKNLPDNYKEKFASLSAMMPQIKEVLSNFDNYFDIFLSILAESSPRHYLIVFQNNSEIRATGGFIGSYALISILQGQIDNLEVKNIFDADGQLIVNVIPPKPIQKISSGWSTHDANWFFDFPTSAEKIAWFFEKTGGPSIDGIIALTPKIVEDILNILGPIELPTYGLTITKDNFIEEIQYKVEEDYDPYQNEPKKVLADFTTLLIEKITNASKEVWPKIIEVLGKSITKKDLILWLKDTKEEELVKKQSWGGNITETSGDYLAIVHSNINGYKTDRFIKEDTQLDISFDAEGHATNELTIKRKHEGGNEAYDWYNKVNSDYVRIYLPKGTKILEASGNTPEFSVPPLDYESLKFKQDSLVASIESTMTKEPVSGVDLFEESGKTVVGGWIYTSPGEESVFKIRYQIPESSYQNFQDNTPKLPIEGALNQAVNYNLILQKQPGLSDNPLRMTISYPDSWRIGQIYPREKLTSQNPIRFRDIIDQDKIFNINFKSSENK
ncbi:MAG: DUF4012 domain-containing protein [Candidatus Paceibacterota bacterium]|jgi:hypothetical protein